MGNWLLVDTTYLCHRAYHSTGHLMYESQATGVAYGIVQTIEQLHDMFLPSKTILAFDNRGSLRRQIYPEYKGNRRKEEYTEEEKESQKIFFDQVKQLQQEYLPMMGFNNIISDKGYEADDVIAKAAQTLPKGVTGIIVTADNDLYQCISDNVHFYNPNKKSLINLRHFKEEWGIEPCLWASVKALAGCNSDNIKGIQGVGEKTAARWYNGTLSQGTKTWHKISENLDIHNENIKLTKLPFEGYELPELHEDEVTMTKKNKLKVKLGMKRKAPRRKEKGDLV